MHQIFRHALPRAISAPGPNRVEWGQDRSVMAWATYGSREAAERGFSDITKTLPCGFVAFLYIDGELEADWERLV